ncbi:exo-alpha-sialidase [Shewanella sp. VB17]|uniref:exo-alpha-sialidase n=1 Tax=Shewanella sp. VB17 TaxID=2739432 RepID=UPI0015639B1C|nr:exo-alpha-sialidase [Shewanella sp. VB17]
MKLVSVDKIWDQGEHNAFTDMVRFGDELYCVFREGSAHVSDDGSLRVIRSFDEGHTWESVVLMQMAHADLRDGKLLVYEGELLLLGLGSFISRVKQMRQSYLWRSDDGVSWSIPVEVAQPNDWLWRLSAHNNVLWGLSYFPDPAGYVSLYKSVDGYCFSRECQYLNQQGYVNESDLIFDEGDNVHCLLRRDPVWEPEEAALLGSSKPPYQDWKWKALDKRIGGPVNFYYQGHHYAIVRLYDDKVRTSVVEIDEESLTIIELLCLPSGGDTSYAGVVLEKERLKISYYSSHEGKTAIYFAVIDM